MPKTLNGDVQTDASNGNKFITIQVIGPDGRKAYRKVYLQTRDHKVARRRAAVLERVNDPAVAREIVAYVAAARTPEQETARLAEFQEIKPLVPAMSADHARADLADLTGEQEIPLALITAWQRADKKQQSEILQSFGISKSDIADNPDMLSEHTMIVNPHFRPQYKAVAKAFNIPEQTAKTLVKDTPVRGPKLSSCISEFETKQEQKNTITRHRQSYINKFKQFIKLVGDKPIRALTKQDFVHWHDTVLKVKKGKSAKTINDQFIPIAAVLQTARQRMPDGIFPDGLDNWLSVLEKKPYKPAPSNRQPMPPEVFKALLAKAEEWIDTEENKYKGLLVHACFCLAANCGARSVDLSSLKWSELLLDNAIPLFTKSRAKSENKGLIIPVKTPLLPETVKSIKRWKEWQNKNHQSDMFFTTIEGNKCIKSVSSHVSRLFKKLRDATENVNGWKASHCINIGETLRRDHNLDSDIGTAWLRHIGEKGTNKFYRGDAKDDYLMPLINIIGETYFK